MEGTAELTGRSAMPGEDGTSGGTQRTFLRRRGRMTRGQARALKLLGPRYLVAPEALRRVLSSGFGRKPLGLEIGFGMGHELIDWARRSTDRNLLGIDVYRPGLGSAMLRLEREGLDNVRLLEAPAEIVLPVLDEASLDEIRIFFPDPWPKQRHHKRRLIQPPLAGLLASRLRPGGRLWIATDWADYGQWIVDVLDGEPALVAEGSSPGDDAPGPGRPETRFESRGLRLGHEVWDLRYSRKC